MTRDAAAAGGGGGGGGEMVAERRPSFVQDCKEAGFVNASERQWHRTVAHVKAFPYLWASYFLIYGGIWNIFCVSMSTAAPSAESSPEAAKGASEQSTTTIRIKAMKQNQQTTAAPSPQLQPNSSSVSL